MFTYTATAPDGTVVTRRASRVFTHGVITVAGDGWRIDALSADLRKAEAVQRRCAKLYSASYDPRVVEVTAVAS